MTIGETLRNLIEEREITQKQLAAALNLSPSTLGGYVQGTSEPDIATLKRIAGYFQVSMDYLLDYSADSHSVPGESELLRIFRSLSEEQRDLYLEQGRAFIKINRKGKSSTSNSTHKNNAI